MLRNPLIINDSSASAEHNSLIINYLHKLRDAQPLNSRASSTRERGLVDPQPSEGALRTRRWVCYFARFATRPHHPPNGISQSRINQTTLCARIYIRWKNGVAFPYRRATTLLS